MSVPKVTKPSPSRADDWHVHDGQANEWQADAARRLSVTPLSALGAPILRTLIQTGLRKRLEPGQMLQQRDDAVEHVVIVVSGLLRIFRLNPAGKVYVLRSIGAGQVFNLLPILDDGPAINDADAAEKTELLLIPKTPFRELMDTNPGLRNAVNRIIYARNRIAYDELADMVLLTLKQRCARVLMSLIRLQHAGVTIPERATLAVSQSELSDILGYSRPKVNAELMALKGAGIIELHYNRIHVPDTALLERVSKA
jgi:CRP/FNR family transcriptional regulator, cyclic AMP receptor protein